MSYQSHQHSALFLFNYLILKSHLLSAFKPFDRSIILTEDVNSYSQTWTDSFQGYSNYQIFTILIY